MIPETCPFCGDELSSLGFDGTHFKSYGCGTTLSRHENPERMRSRDCRIAERDGLKTRVAELEARCKRLEEAGDMLEWRIACGCGQGGPCRHCADTIEAWQKSKEAKP